MPVSKPCRLSNGSNRLRGRGIVIYVFVASVLFCSSELAAFVQRPTSASKASCGPGHRHLPKGGSYDLQGPASKLTDSKREPGDQLPASLLATLLLGLVLVATSSPVLAQTYPIQSDESFFERLGKQFLPLGRALSEKSKDVESRIERIKSISLAESIVRKAETETESQLKKIEESIPQAEKKEAEQIINQIESRKASNPLPETVAKPSDEKMKKEEEDAVAILDEVVGDMDKKASPDEKKVLQAIEKDIAKVEKNILPETQTGIEAAVEAQEVKAGNAAGEAAPQAEVETAKKEKEVTSKAEAAKLEDEKKVKEATAEAKREEMVLKEEVKTIDRLEELKRSAIAEEEQAEQELQKIAAAINEEIERLEANRVPAEQGVARVEELKKSAITQEKQAEQKLQKIRIAINEEVAGQKTQKAPARQETPTPEAAKADATGTKQAKKSTGDFNFKITFRLVD
eukprot:TRINITY_DN63245_c0_g1_i1.p1 TRINITY_DN63245_c0_g1~~TRINITY_DN63245_c0_g1_i1.p1  ORF type:complete len:466 (-),score=126.88 TRINITY_DN63245_c0_g1_i1:53-1429(-)